MLIEFPSCFAACVLEHGEVQSSPHPNRELSSLGWSLRGVEEREDLSSASLPSFQYLAEIVGTLSSSTH